MSLVPTEQEIELKAQALADQEGPGWAAVLEEEGRCLDTGAKAYWLQRAEEALKAERRNAI